MGYFLELRAAMKMLGDQGGIFIGQSVAAGGTSMVGSFDDVPIEQRIEFPVAEDFQMGFCTGLSLSMNVPIICVFPRFNFLLCAANQIVNHLDRLSLYSDYRPKVIIRVAAPSVHPFNPGPQHDDNFSHAFDKMLRTIPVVHLFKEEDIVPEYKAAIHRSTILVEYTDAYRNERAAA